MRKLLVSVTAVIVTLLLVVSSTFADATIDSLTNQFREAHGLAPLKTSSLLTSYAAYRAKQISTDFEHHIPALNAWVSSHFSCWRQDGENIAYRTSPTSDSWAVSAWENSPEHRANMLTGIYTLTGSAHYVAPNGKTYFVQEFLALCSSARPAATPAPVATPRPRPTRKPTPASTSTKAHASRAAHRTSRPARTPKPASKLPANFHLPNTSISCP